MPLTAGIYYFDNDGNWANPAVILIHGAGGSNLSWPPEIRRLKDHRIYAMDLPGHGKSQGIGLQSIADYARSVLDFLEVLKIHKAVFIGHSMGGAVALHLALYHPERTLGLSLIGTAARLPVSADLLSSTSVEATQITAIKRICDLSFGPLTDNRVRELTVQRMAENRYPVLHGDLTACNQFDETNLLDQINVPCLIVCGSDDKMTPPRYSEALHNGIKNSELQIIEGAGHMVMLEKPAAMTNLLDQFIGQVIYQPGSTA